MPRAKKKDPKLDKVTGKPKRSVESSVQSRSKKDDSEVKNAQEPPSRSRRAAASKTKAWESLIPNSRDSPSKAGKDQTAENEVASSSIKRARSRTKKPATEIPVADQEVSKSETDVISTEENSSGRITRRGRSQKKDACKVTNNNSKEVPSKPARAVSVRSSSVRQGRRGKPASPNAEVEKKDDDECKAKSVTGKGKGSKSRGKNKEVTVVAATVDVNEVSEPASLEVEHVVKENGLTPKGVKDREGPLTKVSNPKRKKSEQPSLIEEPLVKDISSTGKWKSFSNQSLFSRNKRLSKEKEVNLSNTKNSSNKRKSSITPDELNPTPTKKSSVQPSSKKVGFQSIARSYAKNGTITQKNAPRKTLCSMDILGLLDDDIEEDADEVPEQPDVDELVPDETLEKNQSGVIKANKDTYRGKDKVPVWKQVKLKDGDVSKTADDVFNPEKYGEEEFGPEDLNPKKKRVRKKKKDTKAILVFGGKSKAGTAAKSAVNEVKKTVKESHNLKTPEVEKKKVRKAAVEGGKKLIQPIPNIFDNPPPSRNQPKGPIIKVTNYSTDISHGAQNYFDSEIHHYEPGDDNPFDCPPENGEEMNRSGAFGESLSVPAKNYKTPAIPKKISRLQSDNSSTPNQKEVIKPLPVTIKEQIKCAFGFDDSEDEEVLRLVYLIIIRFLFI